MNHIAAAFLLFSALYFSIKALCIIVVSIIGSVCYKIGKIKFTQSFWLVPAVLWALFYYFN